MNGRRPNPGLRRSQSNAQNHLNRNTRDHDSSSSLTDDASASRTTFNQNNYHDKRFKNRSDTDSNVASADQDRVEMNIEGSICGLHDRRNDH